VILAWTDYNSYASKDTWFHGAAPDATMDVCYREKILTPDRTCDFITRRTRIAEADAVLFRMRMLDRNAAGMPEKRRLNQHYIVFENEPPHKTWYFVNLTRYNFFNLTATYSWDSDIPVNAHRQYMFNPNKYERLKDVNYAALKRRDVLAAWFVSRFPTQSKREDYVRELQKYIGVDVYGKCGNLTCPRDKHTGFGDDDCIWDLLDETNSYKFYLAFENSLCEDYVTEKLWKVMDARVVPIVMGGVEYGTILPKEAYIDVRDFASPRHLAKYLMHLNDDDALYNQYLRTKEALYERHRPVMYRQCAICKGLYELERHILWMYSGRYSRQVIK
jgi:hypothetical protein